MFALVLKWSGRGGLDLGSREIFVLYVCDRFRCLNIRFCGCLRFMAVGAMFWKMFFVRVFRRLKRGAWGSVPISCSGSNKSVRGLVNVSRIPRPWENVGSKTSWMVRLMFYYSTLHYLLTWCLIDVYTISQSIPVIPIPCISSPSRQDARVLAWEVLYFHTRGRRS